MNYNGYCLPRTKSLMHVPVVDKTELIEVTYITRVGSEL